PERRGTVTAFVREQLRIEFAALASECSAGEFRQARPLTRYTCLPLLRHSFHHEDEMTVDEARWHAMSDAPRDDIHGGANLVVLCFKGCRRMDGPAQHVLQTAVDEAMIAEGVRIAFLAAGIGGDVRHRAGRFHVT